MKLKKLAALCKKQKVVLIYDRADGHSGEVTQQYISDGHAIYPLDGLPELEVEEVLTIFDVAEDKREGWLANRKGYMPPINLADIDDTETPIRHLYPPVIYRGVQLMLCGLEDGSTMIINADYLSPVQEGGEEYYIRQTDKGTRFLAVKAGLMLKAAILPYTFPDPDQMAELGREMLNLGYSLGQMAKQSRGDREEAEQMAI